MAEKTVIQELVARLGFEIDKKTIEQFESGLGRLRSVATAVGGAVTASAAAVFAWAQSAAAAGEQAVLNANALGLTAEAYQEVAFAASLSGVNQEMLRNSMVKLTRSAQEAIHGNADLAATFGELGLNAEAFGRLNADQQLETIADALNRVEEPGRRTAMTMALLGEQGPRLATLLGEGSAGIRALRAEASALGVVLSDDAAAQGEAFGDQLETLKLILQGVKNTIGLEVMPVVSDGIEAFREWFLANREVLRTNVTAMLRGMASAAKTAIAAVVGLVGWVQSAVDAFGGWAIVLQLVRVALIGLIGYQAIVAIRSLIAMVKALAVAYRAMGTAALWAQAKALLVPLAIGAAIAVLVLAVQDFLTFLRGGDSLIGRFVAKFAETSGVLGTVARWLLDLRDVINNWPANWSLIVGFFKDLWTGAIDFVVGLIDGLVQFVLRAADSIGTAWASAVAWVMDLWAAIGDRVRDVIDGIGGSVSWVVGQVVSGFTTVRDFIGGVADFIRERFGVSLDGVEALSRRVMGRIVNGIANVADSVLRLADLGGSVFGIDSDAIASARDRIADMRSTFGDGTTQHVGQAVAPGGGSTTNSVNAGGVTVNVQGTTNMSREDLQRATQDGVGGALQRVLERTNRTFAGAET